MWQELKKFVREGCKLHTKFLGSVPIAEKKMVEKDALEKGMEAWRGKYIQKSKDFIGSEMFKFGNCFVNI